MTFQVEGDELWCPLRISISLARHTPSSPTGQNSVVATGCGPSPSVAAAEGHDTVVHMDEGEDGVTKTLKSTH
jgi:hypothetical protein